MSRVPADFKEEFSEKGDTFFGVAELLYTNPDRRYTQSELADHFGVSTTRISDHTQDMSEWLDRRDNQSTYAWDVEVHNPGSTEGTIAARRFYTDLWHLLGKHSSTVPGMFALLGSIFILAAVVVFLFYLGFVVNLFDESAVPVWIYLLISGVCFVNGLLVSLLSPLQAWVNSIMWSRLPADLFQKNE